MGNKKEELTNIVIKLKLYSYIKQSSLFIEFYNNVLENRKYTDFFEMQNQ